MLIRYKTLFDLMFHKFNAIFIEIMTKDLLFCYQNCSGDRQKLLKFLRSLEQFIQTVYGQNYFW